MLTYTPNDLNAKTNEYNIFYENNHRPQNEDKLTNSTPAPAVKKNCNNKKCPVCNQMFKNLKKHILTHVTKRENVIVCDHCDMMFQNEQDLLSHMKKHNTFKPFR